MIHLSKNSSIEITKLPSEFVTTYEPNSDAFNKLFELKPDERCKIINFKEETTRERFSRSYLNVPKYNPDIHKTYMFSGFETDAETELPSEFLPYFKLVNLKDDEYNQVTVNWYENGNDYVPYHRDCTTGMKEDSDIVIYSLGSPRIISFIPNEKTKKERPSAEPLNIVLNHGDVLRMKGQLQMEYKHSILKELNPNSGRRISISFRAYI